MAAAEVSAVPFEEAEAEEPVLEEPEEAPEEEPEEAPPE